MVGVALSGCCHEIGCTDGVTVQLGDVVSEFPVDEPVEVTVCVDEQCTVETLTVRDDHVEGGSFITPFLDKRSLRAQIQLTEGPHTITFELLRAGNVVFSATREMVTTSSHAPNGPFCKPVCQNALITL